MDFSKNKVLKENYCFFVGNFDGCLVASEHGLYNRDTRFLHLYQWYFPENTQTLLSHQPNPDRLIIHHADFNGHYQRLAIKRHLRIRSAGLTEILEVQNDTNELQKLQLELLVEADFVDLFEARGWDHLERSIEQNYSDKQLCFTYQALDGIEQSVTLAFSENFELIKNRLIFNFELPAKSNLTLHIEISITNPLDPNPVNSIGYKDWYKKFQFTHQNLLFKSVFTQAVGDLRALLLFDKAGTLPAAGIPWFSTAFGRDALITSLMLLDFAPQIAKGTLTYLASHQAKDFDAFRNAQPGKILHEMRYGELSRIGKTPHSPYYGTVDATPLFIILLFEVYQVTGDIDLVKRLQPNWEAALNWIVTYGDLDGDSFVEFTASENGQALSIQSWKDSGDSMTHADGTLAQGRLAVSEVQGYACAAYQAANEFYKALNRFDTARQWETKAAQLMEKFHESFWLKDLQTYAMALDENKAPLKVYNSDAGQLLWTGIVPVDIAPFLVNTLMSNELWTGWGIRTLGKSESRYNPVSYHNGSVWPHDTALIASGMKRYGFENQAKTIAHALFELAMSQPDFRLPELVAGYQRSNEPPIPYPVACRPQAWDAATIVFMYKFL